MNFQVAPLFLFFTVFSSAAWANKPSVVENLKVDAASSEEEQKKKLIATEVLISQSEEKALEHLKSLIVKYKGTSMEPSMRFRLAELYMNRAKSARYIEQILDEGDVISFLPKRIKSLKEKTMVNKGIEQYTAIEKSYPKFQDIDQVIFNKAFAQLQIGQESNAENSFIKLLKTQKKSKLRPDAFLAVGEINFKNRKFKRALAYFKRVKKYKTSRVYPYGIYKGAWCYHNLDAYEQAITELETVIRYGAMVEREKRDQRLDLRVEALSDMALFYSATRNASGASAYFVNLAGNKNPVPAIRKLADIYEKHGKDLQQELVLVDLIKRFKNDDERPFFYRDLTRNLNRQAKYQKASTSLWSFYKNCKVVTESKSKYDADYCQEGVVSLSKKMAIKWLKIFKENKENLVMAAVSENAFRVHLIDRKATDENSRMRFLFAEHLFDLKKNLESSSEYDLVGDSTKDKVRHHQARYASIVSYALAYESKFDEKNSPRFRELSNKYMKDFPEGEKYLDVGFKLAFFDYTNKNYETASPLLLQMGNKYFEEEKGKKSQDLYLDILNTQKNYIAIQKFTKQWKGTEKDVLRQKSLQNLFEQAFFSEVALLENEQNYKKALVRYGEFIDGNATSGLVDEARWNTIDLHFKLKEYDKTAEGYISFHKLHPNSKNAIPGLIKAVEIYEMMAEPEKAYTVTETLSRIDLKDSARWSYLSATYLKASGRYEKAAQRFLSISRLKSQFQEISQDEFFSMEKQLINKSDWYKSQVAQLTASPSRKVASLAVRSYAKGLEQNGETGRLLKFVSKHKWNKKISKDHRALLHSYYGEKRERDYFSYSINNASMDTIVSGIQKKTKNLDSVQSSYQRALEDLDPKVTVKALLGLSRTYQGFVNELKKLTPPQSFGKEEKEALEQELENIVMPFEEKSAEALDQALNVAKKAELKDGSIKEIKILFDKVNLEEKTVHPVSLIVPEAKGPRGI